MVLNPVLKKIQPKVALISFDTYLSGIDFVNKLALIAEENNHHPDLSIGWCKVSVTFTSHDQGGVTDDCIKMAKFSEALYIKK